MKSKASLGLTVASVSLIVITLAVLVLSVTSDNTGSLNTLKNTLSDVILLVCISLFGGITFLRRHANHDSQAQYEIN